MGASCGYIFAIDEFAVFKMLLERLRIESSLAVLAKYHAFLSEIPRCLFVKRLNLF